MRCQRFVPQAPFSAPAIALGHRVAPGVPMRARESHNWCIDILVRASPVSPLENQGALYIEPLTRTAEGFLLSWSHPKTGPANHQSFRTIWRKGSRYCIKRSTCARGLLNDFRHAAYRAYLHVNLGLPRSNLRLTGAHEIYSMPMTSTSGTATHPSKCPVSGSMSRASGPACLTSFGGRTWAH